MSEPLNPPRERRSLLRAAGFALAFAGVFAVFSPLVIGPWHAAGLSAADTGLAIAVSGWLLLIAAAVRRRLRRRRLRAGEP